MYRHVDAAGDLNRQIENDPLVTVLGDLDHAIAGLDAQAGQGGRHPPRIGGNLIPGINDPLIADFDMQRRLIAVGRHAAAIHGDDRIIQLVNGHGQLGARKEKSGGRGGKNPPQPRYHRAQNDGSVATGERSFSGEPTIAR